MKKQKPFAEMTHAEFLACAKAKGSKTILAPLAAIRLPFIPQKNIWDDDYVLPQGAIPHFPK